MSGLGKFEDILNGLQADIKAADYFYFVDGDVRFQEDVLLADIAGDMVSTSSTQPCGCGESTSGPVLPMGRRPLRTVGAACVHIV